MTQRKLKAVTFSYDDGVTQDQRLIEMFNRYGLKCTFNINSGRCGTGGPYVSQEKTLAHVRPRACELRAIYEGHEVAAHTLTHPFLPHCEDAEVVRQVEEDRLKLSEICGYEVVGMAYPCGGANHDKRVETLVREHTGIRYARTIEASGDFAPQNDLFCFYPTVYHIDTDEMFALGERFLALEPETPALFYVWGHSYEFDAWNFWDRFEEFCRMMSGKEDIFYGTNKEVLL
jgi:peptidoglycan/xylan/chitin deacetylase (PgdA/CDA1 family)